MKTVRLLWLLIALLLLCGCHAQLNKEYSSISAHEEQFEVDQHSDALTAENYLGLKNAILSFVQTGSDYGVIRIYTYDGNVVSDLANAVYEVSHNDPLGAYAVDYMTYDYAHIVSYYELYIYTTFRIDTSLIDDLLYCSNTYGVEAELETLLTTLQYYAAIRVSNYQDFDPTAVLHRLFLEHPELGICEPSLSVQIFPSSGIQRIIEFSFSHQHDALTMRSRQESLKQKTAEVIQSLSLYSREDLRVQQLYRWFYDHVTYMGEGSSLFSNAYNALVNEYSNSLGFSMATQLLCNELNIPCFTVEGSYEGSLWYWNMVYYNDQWCHIDIAQGLINDVHVYAPLYDEDMVNYTWPVDEYPACPDPTPEPLNEDLPEDPASSTIDTDLDQLPPEEPIPEI